MSQIIFQHQSVRDLAWVLTSPGLLRSLPSEASNDICLVSDDWAQKFGQYDWQKLQRLDEDPSVLEDFVSQRKSSRLGLYFESLLGFWFSQQTDDVDCWRNMPVFSLPGDPGKATNQDATNRNSPKSGKQTLGEYDLLLHKVGDSYLYHWELTVKFYLQWINTDGQCEWIGPAAQDQLARKLGHMLSHQLNLSRTDAGRATISALGFNDAWPQALVKGYLFYPAFGHQFCESEFDISPAHLRGWWVYQENLAIPQQNNDSRWVALPRLQWLSPAYVPVIGKEQPVNDLPHNGSLKLMETDELQTFCDQWIMQYRQPVLLAEVTLKEDGWHECARGFVVPNAWPYK